MNHKQALAIAVVVLGVLMVSTTQLTELFGPGPTKIIVSAAGLLNSIIGGILGIVSSQTGLLKDVQAMPGVQSVQVNANANSTLAQAAVDPANPKIEAAPGSEAAVTNIANRG